MKPTLGIILNNPNIKLGALTDVRSVITLPFATRYRLIDFPLSNMVNSHIEKIGVFASDKYRSLIDHIGTGQEWSMSRKRQDLVVLQGGIPNYMGNHACRINLADFHDNFGLFNRNSYANLIISGSNMVCNIDLIPVMQQHEESGADVTLITKRVVAPSDRAGSDVSIRTDGNGTVVAISDVGGSEYDRVYLDIMVIRGNLLIKAIQDSLITRSYDLIDILSRNLTSLRIGNYDYSGYYRRINSIESFYTANMDMLNPVIASRVFDPTRTIFTKSKDNPPTRYSASSHTSNALIASGCTISGSVRDSIIFRRVQINEGATIQGSIIMEQCTIGRNVILENVILDRMVTVSDNVVLQGTPENPVVLGKETHI